MIRITINLSKYKQGRNQCSGAMLSTKSSLYVLSALIWFWDAASLHRVSTFSGLGILPFHIWHDFQISQTFCWWLPMESKLIDKRGRSGWGVNFTTSLSDLSGCHLVIWRVDQITFTLTRWCYRSLSYYFYVPKDPIFPHSLTVFWH